MGTLAFTIGEVVDDIQFDDTVGTETLRQFYDSMLSANDDPANPPTDREKLRAILGWVQRTIVQEARGHYEHTERVRQQQTIADEARNKFKMESSA